MTAFVWKRLAFAIPQLFIVIAATFVLLRVLPVDPASRIVGSFATPTAYAHARHELGLDRTIVAQFSSYMSGLVKGDFGQSWVTQQPVGHEIAVRFPVTLQLIGLGFLLALAVAIPLGRATAHNPGGRAEKGITVYALFAGAQPDFWWGIVFIYIFFFVLGWAPAPLGVLDPSEIPPNGPTHFILLDTLLHGEFALWWSAVQHYALPVLTEAFVLTGPILKMVRQSTLDVSGSEYMLYARATGMPSKRIRRISTRNGFIPVLTIVGILFGFSLGGAVLIETVFSLNGLGRYALASILAFDYPAIQGAVVVMAAFALLIYLTMDVLYAALDPRVRYGVRQ